MSYFKLRKKTPIFFITGQEEEWGRGRSYPSTTESERMGWGWGVGLKCKVSMVTRKRARIGQEHYWKTIKEEMPPDIIPSQSPLTPDGLYILWDSRPRGHLPVSKGLKPKPVQNVLDPTAQEKENCSLSLQMSFGREFALLYWCKTGNRSLIYSSQKMLFAGSLMESTYFGKKHTPIHGFYKQFVSYGCELTWRLWRSQLAQE